jgi:hypothetical protein
MKKHLYIHLIFIIFTLFVCKLESALAINAWVDVSYIGLDKTHIRYSASGEENTKSIELKRNSDVIESVSGQFKGLDGKMIDYGLAPDKYQYSVVHTTTDGKVDTYNAPLITINGESVGGTLLFDEVISAESKKISTYIEHLSSFQDVTIPDGNKIIINDAILDLARITGNRISLTDFSHTIPASLTDNAQRSLNANNHKNETDTDVDKSISFNSCIFDNTSISDPQLYSTVLMIKDSSPSFINNTFKGWVWIEGLNRSVFEDNLFLAGVTFQGATSDVFDPTFENNSFLGASALYGPKTCTKPISIGPNYYGDDSGPLRAKSDIFIGNRGAIVQKECFSVVESNKTGKHFPASVSPRFWLQNYIVGQNAINHLCDHKVPVGIQGKETLLSIEIGTTHKMVKGAKVIVEFDGADVSETSKKSPTILVRDLVEIKDGAIANGTATFDFILPPTHNASAQLKAWLDTTMVEGFDTLQKSKFLIIDQSLLFDPEPRRKLRLFIQPVDVIGIGSPDTIHILNPRVRALFSAMLPLARSDIEISEALIPLKIIPGAGITSGLSLYPIGIANSALRSLLSVCDWAAGADTSDDFTISVFPQDSFPTGVDGMNLQLFRSTLFVTENKLKAVIHELGHAGPRIYLDIEQYDDYRWKDTCGMPLKGMTIFVNDGAGGRFSDSLNMFLHLPWSTKQRYIDIMGSFEPSWIAVETLDAFKKWLTTYLTAKSDRNIASKSSPPPSGKWRIFVNANVEKDSVYPARQRLVQGTVTAFNVSVFADKQITHSQGESVISYAVYDKDGNEMERYPINIPDDNSEGGLDYFGYTDFQFTCDIPDSAARLDVYNPVYTAQGSISDSEVVFSVNISDQLSTRIISPISGATLSAPIVVEWQTQASSILHMDASKSQPLQHHVHVSQDGGTTWNPLGWFIEGQKLEIPFENLPASNTISLRVITSDGLRYVEDRVNNLHILPRPPVVKILYPREGDRAVPEHPWSFVGESYSTDETLEADGQWTSSLDGVLGYGTSRLENIVLSSGDHVVTYSVSDSRGLVGHDTVNVSVGKIESFDFQFDPDALKVTVPGKDSYAQKWAPLSLGEGHAVALSMRNVGTDSILQLRLFITYPGAQEILLAEQDFVLGPFDEAKLSGIFTPDTEGAYNFRAVVTPITPTDNNPDNNQRTWTLSTSLIGSLTVSTAGNGLVNSNPSGISCGTTCSGNFERGGFVILTAVPASGAMFKRWEGDCSGSENTCAIIVNSKSTVKAVFQKATEENWVLSVSPVSRNVTNASDITTFSVSNTGTGAMPWTAAVISDSSWLSITSGSSGTDTGTINCGFTANTSTSSRTAIIRVTAVGATGSPVDVTVTQAPTPDQPVVSVSPVSRDVAKAAGATTFSVSNTGTGTMPWTAAVTTGGSWLTITSGASGTNSGTINCSYPSNTTTSPRTGTIRVTAAGTPGSTVDVTVTQAGAESLAASFADSGLWIYNSGTASWSQVSSANPENMIYSGSTLYVDFGASYGLYKWDGAEWTQLTSANPENMVTSGSTLYVDFGASYGLYKLDGTTSTWSQLTSVNPENMVTTGSSLYADFGALGLYKWDGTAWTQLTSTNPENMVTAGSLLYADFGTLGLYKWDGTEWTQLTSTDPENMVIAGSLLYADFRALGLYKWDGTAWTQLASVNPENMVSAGSILLYADFGASYGLYNWDGAVWDQLTTANPENMVTSSGSALYVNFGVLGLYKWESSSWSQLTGSNPAIMAVSN